MRSFILGVISVLVVSEQGFSQSHAISQPYAYASNDKVDSTKPQKEHSLSLSVMLKSLEAQYNVRFNYDSKLVKDKTVTDAALNSSEAVEGVLSRLLEPLELSFEKVKDNYYVILRNDKGVADIVVKGTVTDKDGLGLPGVSVRLKGSNLAVLTDVNGAYSINIPDGSGTLVFSFIGFNTQELAVAGRNVVNVQLTNNSKTLEEVVVVGYGSQRRGDITGSVGVVNVADMKKTSSNDVGQLLQGRVSGVVVNSDGQPGAFPQVRIRGFGTFGNSDPLYVIDGVTIEGVPRDFNPNDIESVQVLKDASAGAIYGSKAANGVVIITTKQGKKNTPLKVDYSGYYGVDKIWQIMPVTNRANYIALNNESRLNAGQAIAPAHNPASSTYNPTIDTDWQKEGLKLGNRQNHSIGLSGGGTNTTYNISLDYFGNAGTFEGNGPDYKRYTGRVNTTGERGRFKIGQSFFYARSKENGLTTADGVLAGGRPPLINDLVFAIPTMAIYDAANKGGFAGTETNREDAISLNGIGYNSLIKNTTDVDRIFGNFYGEAHLVKGDVHNLKFKLNFGYDKVIARDFNFIPQFYLGYFFVNPTARMNDNSRNYTNNLIENTLTYDAKLGKHSLSVLAGQMYQTFDTAIRTGSAQGFTEPYLYTLSNGTSSDATSFESEYNLSSYLGRINYSYDDKYLLTGTLRRDGSSRFGKNNQFGYFPSIALGWKISNERFFEPVKSVVTDLKFRGSYGELGNTNIADYIYFPSINSSVPYSFGSVREVGAIQTNVVDESIKWEEKAMSNVGFDATLLSGKIDVSAEYYASKTTDALLGISYPMTIGAVNRNITTNAASLRNSGIEVNTTFHKNKGAFKFDITGNFSTIKNKVLGLGTGVSFREGAGSITEVGGEVGRHYGYVFEKIIQTQAEVTALNAAATAKAGGPAFYQNPATAPGDVKFKDLNGDGVVTPADRTYLGSAIPKFNYGLNWNASYKSFDFTLFASGSAKYKIRSRLYADLMHSGGRQNYHEDMLDRWTPTNPSNTIPRLHDTDPNENGRISDRPGFLQDGTYLRINTLSLGYTLPKTLIKGVSRARVNISGQNVYTFQKYKGYNPDFSSGVFEPGWDNGSFPKPRTLMFGLQVGF